MKTCLVVDDSKVIRKVARHILETLDFTVTEACDGREALDACLASAPDVILLDWNMPVMSGLPAGVARIGYPLAAEGRVLHHRKRHGLYPRRNRCGRRRICHEAVRP